MAKKTISASDSLGTVEIPADALYRAQTRRALDNFRISELRLPRDMVRALALIKQAAARSNAELGRLDDIRAHAIADAAAAIAAGEHADQFQVDVFQTGSGTSSNMNLNEVIATLAGADGTEIDANDHVNMGQSSNDVFPSAIHVAACLALHERLLPAITALHTSLIARAREHADTLKTGRTHLMDAMPIALGQEIAAWASQLEHDRQRIENTQTRLRGLAIGGTAVGTGVNTPADFGARICRHLLTTSGIEFEPMPNLFEGLASQNTALELSGQLRVLATTLAKVSNDLRWMNSGPLTGLGEISLKPLQPGSSIMPAKVNPVIPEAVLMVSAQVAGNDTSIGIAAQSGNFQLNVMLPLIAHNLLQSIGLLANACEHLAECIDGFSVNHDVLEKNLARNPILVTALNPLIGYRKAVEIAKRAMQENRPILEVALEMTDIEAARLARLLDPARLAYPYRETTE